MSPIVPDPDPVGLPAPVALLKLLLVALLPLHLVAMNLALGGGFVAAWAAWRGRRRAEPESRRLGDLRKTLTTTLVVSTAAAITLGVAPLLFLQVLYGQLFYTSSVLMAWWWLAVVGLLLTAYYSYYGFVFRQRGGSSCYPFALAGAVLLVVVGFLFTNNMTLMLRPERWAEMYAASAHGFHLNLGDATHGPRFLHFLVASFAVTGLFIALRRRRATDDSGVWQRTFGARLFAGATHVQLLVGLGFLFTLPHEAPREVRQLFLGGSVAETVTLWGAIALALLATLVVRRRPVAAAGLLGLTIFAMAFVRHRVREVMLAEYFSAGKLKVEPQIALLALFVVLLLAGLVVLGWMIRRFVAATPARD